MGTGTYFAEMNTEYRQWVRCGWMKGVLAVVVAAAMMGMGCDTKSKLANEGVELDAPGVAGAAESANPAGGGGSAPTMTVEIDSPRIAWRCQLLPWQQWALTYNCGPACVFMWHWHNLFPGQSASDSDFIAFLEWFEQNVPGYTHGAQYYGTATTTAQLALAATTLGYSAQAVSGMTAADLQAELVAGNPVVVCVLTQSGNATATMQTGGLGHFMLVVGVSPTTVTVLDPGRGTAAQGDYRTYTWNSFAAVWATYNYAAVTLAPNFPPPTGWQEMANSATGFGISGNTGVTASAPSAATTAAGVTFVAYRSGVSSIHVKKYDPTGAADWVEATPGSASGTGIGMGSLPMLVLDLDDRPCVFWAHIDNTLYGLRLVGQTWMEMAGSFNPGIATDVANERVAAATASNGDIYVAWSGFHSGTRDIFLKRFDGTAWNDVSGSSMGNGISNTLTLSQWPALAISSTAVYIAWSEFDTSDNSCEIFARRSVGNGAWLELTAGSASGTGISGSPGVNGTFPAVVVGGNQTVLFAWEEAQTGVLVKRFSESNSQWSSLNGGNSIGTLRILPKLHITAGGTIFLAGGTLNSNCAAYRLELNDAWTALTDGAGANGVADTTTNGLLTATSAGEDLQLFWQALTSPNSIHGKIYR